jgi:alpha-L-fucosidase
MKTPIRFLFLFLLLCPKAHAQLQPTPTPAQLAWHQMEYYFFMHFGPNTFTGNEWGSGAEPAAVFNPTQLNCMQWAQVAKQSGAKAIIITAKHHDGFCLWPSKYSTHTVRESKWKNGQGDVLKELSIACKAMGLKFGVYISPWDRNHPLYGTSAYNDVFVNMMKEIFTNYGPITELWWDGANGEGPNGKQQVYDFDRFKKTVNQLSPNTIIFSDLGPHIRWVGNEQGFAGTTNWNFLDTTGFAPGQGAPPTDTLTTGNYFGKHYIPAECDVSIRPGWFYRTNENDKVKTAEQLFNIYLKSVGRGANLLLNVPPNTSGLISEQDVAALLGFKKLRASSFNTNLLANASIIKGKSEFDITLKKPTTINTILLKENLLTGKTIRTFTIALYNGSNLVHTIKGTSIGHKRILSFNSATITSIKILLNTQNLLSVAAYKMPNNLIEK